MENKMKQIFRPKMYIGEGRRSTDTVVAENITDTSGTIRRSQSDRTEYGKKLKDKMASQDTPTSSCPALDPQEIKSKMMAKRLKVIQELLQTEKDYLTDLELCIKEVVEPLRDIQAVEVDRLFINIESIKQVSASLLANLEEATAGVDPEIQIIGKPFSHVKVEMEEAYKNYCYYQDDANSLLSTYEKDEEVNQQFINCIMTLKTIYDREGKSNLLNMRSFMIKPVQRVMKYPLLLRELWNCTPDSHPDIRPLEEALNAVNIINSNINEFKRGKDLVMKYKKNEEEGRLRNKINKFSFHSLRKKSDRVTGHIKRITGKEPQIKDEKFDKEEKVFKNIEKAVRQLTKNVSDLLQALEGISTAAQNDQQLQSMLLDPDKSESECPLDTRNGSNPYLHFKNKLEHLVLKPLSTLQFMFVAPQKLIQKRYDKLLDYDSSRERSSDELELARRDYEALNAQLVEGLQVFNPASKKILTNCIYFIVALFQDLMNSTHRKFPSIQHLSAPLSNISEVQNSIMEELNNLLFVKENAPKLIERKLSFDKPKRPAPESPRQSEAQRVKVLSTYPLDKVHQLKRNCNATQERDLSLFEGELVAVIEQQDPLGSTSRWLVDTGSEKGYVYSSFLKPYNPIKEQNGNPQDRQVDFDDVSIFVNGSKRNSMKSLNSFSSINDIQDWTETDDNDSSASTDDQQIFYAVYPFQARCEQELSLLEYQRVRILKLCDASGNREWWLAEANGQKGYVPANYLGKMSYA
ncbi:rho guanine nucleotide exchange factor 38 isoform X2 [Polypterus senegalus]|uniref:rho guanine nucleotide exchange factor 38 isoform X2 n=1 Tax=Polypterus senegalus TaxID=55291 RepID=UPI0019659B88|nr:rho guanine nucleotide exchange factor 38 isoform X2 [Polypterus senegalus]